MAIFDRARAEELRQARESAGSAGSQSPERSLSQTWGNKSVKEHLDSQRAERDRQREREEKEARDQANKERAEREREERDRIARERADRERAEAAERAALKREARERDERERKDDRQAPREKAHKERKGIAFSLGQTAARVGDRFNLPKQFNEGKAEKTRRVDERAMSMSWGSQTVKQHIEEQKAARKLAQEEKAAKKAQGVSFMDKHTVKGQAKASAKASASASASATTRTPKTKAPAPRVVHYHYGGAGPKKSGKGTSAKPKIDRSLEQPRFADVDARLAHGSMNVEKNLNDLNRRMSNMFG